MRFSELSKERPFYLKGDKRKVAYVKIDINECQPILPHNELLSKELLSNDPEVILLESLLGWDETTGVSYIAVGQDHWAIREKLLKALDNIKRGRT